jgi:hypothetical protein
MRYRRRLFPRLVSCASVDAVLAGEMSDGRDPLLDLARVRAGLEKDSAAARYLEARLFERDGQLAEAAGTLEPLLADPAAETVAVLRLAGLRAQIGRRDEALELIEQRFARSTELDMTPWAIWTHLASHSPKLSISERIERLARRLAAPPGEKGRSPLEDVVWALRSLDEDGVLRLHCGGDQDYKDAIGHVWGRDRFFTGGRLYPFSFPRLSGTTEPALYHLFRAFDQGSFIGEGYRIPMPSGGYDVVLHFCQTVHMPEPWSFDLIVEGDLVEEGIAPTTEPGEGVVFQKRCQVLVSDGALDITFGAIRAGALINAIEVRLLDDEHGAPRDDAEDP